MAEIGGMLAASVLKMAAGKMAEAAGDRIMLHGKFDEDLEEMEDTVESIQAVLEDAERQSMVNASVRLWLKRLTRASNDISDMFDEFEINKTRNSALRKIKVLNPCLKLGPEVGMGSKMKKVREKLESISNHHHKFSFMASSSSNVQQAIDERATSSEVIEANILGRDEETQEVVKLLTRTSTSSELIILPIYGIGGMGKTALAQLLFNDTRFKDYKQAWVYVGQIFDLKKIKDSVNTQLQMYQGQLCNTQGQDAGPSAPKNILIVLDDLWEEGDSKLTDLKDFLKMVGNGCKVHAIVTTRYAGIAEKIKENEAYKIKPLSPFTCWTIIKQIVGFEDRTDKEILKEIGISIAGKCDGVALAARTIGYLLKYRDLTGWVSVQKSGIWNASRSGSSPYDNVLASLKLSYSNMPAYLRLCFAYCAIFPKGHNMAKHDLIYQWAALGFVNSSDEISFWQNGENCIKQLLDMSFFQHLKSPWIDGKYGKDVQFFTMHDLLHDLARLIMGDELLDGTTKCNYIKGRNHRYAFLSDCSKPLSSFVTYPDKIRALCFLGGGETVHYHAGFSTAKYLKVLDLQECSLEKLPSSIGQLKLLRYLNAQGIKDRVIPGCVTKLSKLIFLSLRGSCELLALPESIGKMEGLMYLDLSGCSKIRKLPRSFGKLESLVHLDLSFCCRINGIPEALCSLTKLKYLNLSQKWDAEEKINLQGLSEVFRKLSELRYLNVSGCTELISIDLDELFGNISTLSNLEHLDLSSNYDLETIPDSICSLRKLHTLDLTRCQNLCRLPGNMGHMENLKFLIVNMCISLDWSTLPINKSLTPLPNFVVHASEGEQSCNLILLKDVNPPDLEISRLENVTSVEESRRIELRGKTSMVDLTLDWTSGTKGFVEDMELLGELKPPNNLISFRLQGYNSVSFPTWLMDIDIYLPNLVTVTLKRLPQCSSLPPLGQLPNLEYLHIEDMPRITKIDRGIFGDAVKAFTRLKDLTISDMENLEEWSTTYSYGEGVAEEFMFPNLERLTIIRCGKLRLKPCAPIVTDTWKIKDSDSVLLQWEESVPRTVFSTFCLMIESCTAMHQWKLLHHLHALYRLTIKNCNDLSSSPEITRVLNSLQSLTLENCPGIQELPQWLGDLTSLLTLVLIDLPDIHELPEWLGDFVSLNDMTIVSCGIMSLPESIQQLTNLENLVIRDCPELHKWCKLEENKARMGHIIECFGYGETARAFKIEDLGHEHGARITILAGHS